MDVSITGQQAVSILTIASPVVIGWWIKSSLDKLDEIKIMNHKIHTLSNNMKELKGEMRMIIEMGKSMAVLESKANTLFKKYDDLNERISKIGLQI